MHDQVNRQKFLNVIFGFAVSVIGAAIVATPNTSFGQELDSSPYRFRSQESILFEMNGKPVFYPGGFSGVPWCEVDLLVAKDVQKELAISPTDVRRIEHRYKEYLEVVRNNRDDSVAIHRKVSDEAKQEIDKYRQHVLDALTTEQQQSLFELDRFLYLRRFGLTKFLRTFRTDHDLPSSSMQLAKFHAKEAKIWDVGFQKGHEAWQARLKKIVELLAKDKEVQAWVKPRLKYFNMPFVAEISIVNLDADQKRIARDPKSVDFEDFVKLAELEVSYRTRLDGQWEKKTKRIHDRLYVTFGTVLHLTKSQEKQYESNELEITAKQSEQLNQLQKELNLEMNEKFKDLNAKAGRMSKDEIQSESEEILYDYCQSLWNQGFMPHQQQYLMEIMYNLDDTREALSRLIHSEKISKAKRNAIRRELVAYESELEKIEIEVLEKLLELAKGNYERPDVGIKLDARPDYLKPSLSLMYRNSGRIDYAGLNIEIPKKLYDR